MKRIYYILLFLSVLSLMSFSFIRRIGVVFYIENIKENENTLKIKFKTFDFQTGNPINYEGGIDILKNDTLYIRLIRDTIKNNSCEIILNTVPKGFKLIYPENTSELPLLNKKDNLKFIFLDRCYEWTYNPYFSNENARWLFDEKGKQLVEIHCEYEPWLFGSDLINVKMNKEYEITKSNVTVLDEKKEKLDFELKLKRNPTNKFALRLKNKIKTGKKVMILIDFQNKNHYEEIIKIPKKDDIGILGKYGDL